MEIYERIRILRKNHLKLTQKNFGNCLGVSRDTIGNIELNRLVHLDQKLSLIKLICKEFSVNEDWILNGNEPIFVESNTFSLDEFVKQRGGTDLELQIVKTYFNLAPSTRRILIDHFKEELVTAILENPKRMEYEAREKAIRDYNQGMLEAKQRGREIGREAGRKEDWEIGRKEGWEIGRKEGQKEGRKAGEYKRSIQIAKNMLAMGLSKDMITQATGLSFMQIEQLSK